MRPHQRLLPNANCVLGKSAVSGQESQRKSATLEDRGVRIGTEAPDDVVMLRPEPGYFFRFAAMARTSPARFEFPVA